MGGTTRPPYPAGFRQQIVELYASGRQVADLPIYIVGPHFKNPNVRLVMSYKVLIYQR
jgi:hypothetical protein